MTPIFHFKKQDGSTIWRDRERLQAYIGNLPDGDYENHVKKHENSVTVQQHRYYRGVVVPIISEETGYTTDEVHYLMGKKFLSYVHNDGTEFIRSTASLKTKEMVEFTENVKRWASIHLSCYIPDPGEVDI